ncbi:MAG: DUF4149 domain-containing protein [Acidobacteria bacterium]|nr:DUF4149 domain-containing protein [Acidobacteriota bacterium]
MSMLRLLAVLALAFWAGGLVVLGAFTAPTLFEVLQLRDPKAGRELAGLLFGDVLQRFQFGAWAAAGMLIVSLVVRALLGPRPRWFFVRLWIAAAMLAASIVTARLITPRIDGIRRSVAGPIAALADDDQRKISFGRWHALSFGLMLFTIVGGVGLIYWEVRDH